MTQSLERLTRRTESMKSIRGIVHTMKTLSVINAAPYDHAARAIEAYHDTVLTGFQAFLHHFGPWDAREVAIVRRVLIVFGSDHGLCGNYNEALAAHVAQAVQNWPEGPVTLLCVGAQMEDALTDQGMTPKETLFPPASVDGIGRLSNLLTQRLDDIRHAAHPGDISVSLAYFTRDGGAGQVPEIKSLLPLDTDLLRDLSTKPWASRSLPSFTLAPDEMLSALIREHLFASMFRAAAEALVTENAARMSLMQQAEQSIDDRLEGLTGQIRTVRQDDITTELLDVIVGFEALKKGKKRKKAKAD
ncbi:MAG: F0F1 ATP synthase subunit gamma [Alphaproteobacteria bacterium]|nr:F0F1 ATP synthase subunit gamma [Alphaproteobacteria bacterium]MBU1279211.1 F0F1 ATP synthase subunit gamma [Alphaproteobacteria bacterium]MBU1574393.1 F0F1 ATP synthase subunit gamma [Alphaproteobacteria bacterium]MBU1830107.1 F0F1 ATP synthase subunit gamma [Alphaproteobacteria bacterium]MBU2079589.1 F0F1 ATP synthase subunit gamma [Alphaproteobacteria bacterium]